MNKFLSFILSLVLFQMTVAPVEAMYATDDSVSQNEGQEGEMTPLITSTAADSDEIVCPDADAEITFSGVRATFIAKLKTENPERYAEIIARMELRQERLANLCEKHPRLYQKIMRRQEWVMERKVNKLERKIEKWEDRGDEEKVEKWENRLEERRAKMLGRYCLSFPNAPKCANMPTSNSKLDNDDDREEFCQDHPGAADCTEDMSHDDDTIDDDDGTMDQGGENDDDDDDNDNNDDDDDDDDDNNGDNDDDDSDDSELNN